MHKLHHAVQGQHPAGTKDMTEGNLYSLMLGFALPVLLSQIFQQLYNTADAFIVDRCLGTFAFLPITSFNMASTTFISQNLGAKKYDRAKKGARFSILAAVLLAEVIGIGYFVFAPWLIGMFFMNKFSEKGQWLSKFWQLCRYILTGTHFSSS